MATEQPKAEREAPRGPAAEVRVPCEKMIGSLMEVYEYGASDRSEASRLLHPIFEEEERVPKFLRKVHRLNSIYPNFYHPQLDVARECQSVQAIAKEMQSALKLIDKIADQVFFLRKVPKIFPNQFLQVDYFVKSGWESKQEVLLIEDIRPKASFRMGCANEDKLFLALKNYQEVANYYFNYVSKDLQTREGQHHYLKIRDKFWKLEKNIRTISEDVYSVSLGLGYPSFFYEYLSVLRSPAPSLQDKRRADRHKTILGTVIDKMQKNDPLSVSAVGVAVRAKLEKELKLLHPF